MYGSVDKVIDLPEVVKEKKRRHKPTNLMGVMPFRAFYDDDPLDGDSAQHLRHSCLSRC